MLSRDEEIINCLWVAETLARKYAAAYGMEYQNLYDRAEEVIIRIYGQWKPEKGKFSTFAWRCCERTIQQHIVRRQRMNSIDCPVSFEDISDSGKTYAETLAAAENVHDTVEARDVLQKAVAYAAMLNEVQRKIVQAILQGYRGAEIGRALKINERTFRRNKAWAIAALKKASGY